jgi:hypothetical protein
MSSPIRSSRHGPRRQPASDRRYLQPATISHLAIETAVLETREPELIPIRRIPGLGNAMEPLNRIIRVYAYEIGDRISHDRELCYFIAQTVMDIGFDGETVEGMRSQWVERERWPSRIKEILRARDRGKCAACGVAVLDFLARKLPNGRAVVYQDNKAVDHMLASGLPDADAILMAAEEGLRGRFCIPIPFGHAVADASLPLRLCGCPRRK